MHGAPGFDRGLGPSNGQSLHLPDTREFTSLAFRRLLEWLDDGVDSHGETYLDVRRRLVAYFDRRNRPAPEDLADETLDRVATTLAQDGAIALRPPERYCYVMARFVLLEDLRRREHAHVSLDHRAGVEAGVDVGVGAGIGVELVEAAADAAEAREADEQRFECLRRCLEQLKPAQRELIVGYYDDAGRQKIERRREMAARLGISMNALSIRACRARVALEACIAACRKQR